ncbi:MAG: nuclear transport factor 2 family protein [Gemmatimonadota bacterium]|nr:MAG: nuclear transport factor 2 family protein [Gemmatimonadota bacterium]
MSEAELQNWLEAYRQAWETRDPEAAVALFSDNVKYYETPFGLPAEGRPGVRDYWANATRGQVDIGFSHEVLFVSQDRGIARWWASFTRVSTGARIDLDGVFLLEFDHEGLCRELREWWHRAER